MWGAVGGIKGVGMGMRWWVQVGRGMRWWVEFGGIFHLIDVGNSRHIFAAAPDNESVMKNS